MLILQGFSEGVGFLARLKETDIDLKDKKVKGTALFCAIKAKDPDCVNILIANGADLDHKCAGKTLRDHIR